VISSPSRSPDRSSPVRGVPRPGRPASVPWRGYAARSPSARGVRWPGLLPGPGARWEREAVPWPAVASPARPDRDAALRPVAGPPARPDRGAALRPVAGPPARPDRDAASCRGAGSRRGAGSGWGRDRLGLARSAWSRPVRDASLSGRRARPRPEPAPGRPRLASWRLRPASGRLRPASWRLGLASGRSRSALGRLRPASGRPRPVSRRSRLPSVRPRSISRRPWLPSVRPRSAFGRPRSAFGRPRSVSWRRRPPVGRSPDPRGCLLPEAPGRAGRPARGEDGRRPPRCSPGTFRPPAHVKTSRALVLTPYRAPDMR